MSEVSLGRNTQRAWLQACMQSQGLLPARVYCCVFSYVRGGHIGGGGCVCTRAQPSPLKRAAVAGGWENLEYFPPHAPIHAPSDPTRGRGRVSINGYGTVNN